MRLTKWVAALAAGLHLASLFGIDVEVFAALLALTVALAECNE
jgi:hypothetical protein